MNKKKRVMLLMILILAGLLGYYLLSRDRENSSPIILSGNIEVTDARIGFRIPGRLLERLVDEGEEVRKGQLIARLDDTDQELAVARAKANLAQARAALAELETGSRKEEILRAEARVAQARALLLELERGSRSQEISNAEAEVERARAVLQGAQARLELARSDDKRFGKLRREGVISEREYDIIRKKYESALSAYEEARARLASARERLSLRREGAREEKISHAKATLREAEAAYALVKEGPRKETIDQARARVRLAEVALQQARQQLEYTRLRAPFSGVVLSKAAEPGEYLQVGSPVVTIGILDRVWLRAYVNERDLGHIKLGQPVEVRTDTIPKKTFRGHVSFISSEAEFTPKSVETHDERIKLVYRVKIDLPNPEGELKPGMPADAVIEAADESHGE